ncbi:MAG TPA: hypothetical protein VGE35_00210 [Candidatus Paceibacterota bacterium]
MDPEKNPAQSNTPVPESAQKSAAESLRDEGIDIVGSGVSEENEFSATEAASAEPSAATETSEAQDIAQIEPKPPVQTAAPQVQNIPSAAQIIASLRQQKAAPATPVTPAEKPALSTESAKLISSLQEMPSNFKAAPRMPVPPPPAPQPVPQTVLPTYAPATATAATDTKASEPAAQSAPQPAAALNDPSIKQIRTFKSDAEEAVRYQNVSAVDIALAEQKKRERTQIQYEAPQTHHAGTFILVVIILMVVLGGGWYFWFSSSQVADTGAPASNVSIRTIIPYAKASTIVMDPESDSLVLIAAKLKQLNAGLGNTYALVPIASPAATSQADIASVFRDTAIPNRLLRSLDQNYMIGTYTYDTLSPFFIIKNTFFQNAFSGMLEWEKGMRRDLLPLTQIAHETETSVTAASSQFEDAIVSNIDARVLKDSSGKTVLIYAFADKNTIVVTTGESTLKYILERLLTVRTIQ